MSNFVISFLLQLAVFKSFLCAGTGQPNNKTHLSKLNLGRHILQMEAIIIESPGCNSNIYNCGDFNTGEGQDAPPPPPPPLLRLASLEECGDVAPDDQFTCNEQKSFGQCQQQWMISGDFCKTTCDRCSSTATAAVTSTPTPNTDLENQSCDDIPPENADFGCDQYSSLGLCAAIPQLNCQISCGRCIKQECTDVLLPGTSDCTSVVDLSLCDQDSIKGVYCRLSCGDCSSSAPTPISTPAPTPTSAPAPISSPAPISTPATPTRAKKTQGGCEDADSITCDIEGLLAFKSSVRRGEDILASWVGDDPCSWKYVICNRVDGTNKRVTVLDFDFYQTKNEYKISASLVPDLSKLRYLEILGINTQNITGQLPKEYSVLEKLVEFDVYRTYDITGTLPPDYSALTNLQEFVVSFNQLTGAIPPQYSMWNSITKFIVTQNQLTSTIPLEFSVFTNMVSFAVNENAFTGQLSPAFSEWKGCAFVYGYENRFTGTLPVQYSVMSQMLELGLARNKLTGSLPVEYSEWVDCEAFSVFDNFFTGTLPRQYSTFENLDLFSVSSNRLTGSYPEEYSTWRKLETFESFDNKITDTIPSEWQTFSDFAEISV